MYINFQPNFVKSAINSMIHNSMYNYISIAPILKSEAKKLPEYEAKLEQVAKKYKENPNEENEKELIIAQGLVYRALMADLLYNTLEWFPEASRRHYNETYYDILNWAKEVNYWTGPLTTNQALNMKDAYSTFIQKLVWDIPDKEREYQTEKALREQPKMFSTIVSHFMPFYYPILEHKIEEEKEKRRKEIEEHKKKLESRRQQQ
jgi:hypothetical protein